MNENVTNDGVTVEKGSATVSSMVAQQGDFSQSSHLSVTLPTGYLDGDGILHRQVDIRPFTGAEEDILASRKMPMYRRLGRLLENCVTRIGDIDRASDIKKALRGLVFSDRLFLVVQIRIATNGSVYRVEAICPEDDCQHKSIQFIPLDELEWEPVKEPERREYKCKLAGTNKEVSWNIMDGNREEKVHEFSFAKDPLSIGIYARLNTVDGKKVRMDTVKNMSPAQRRALRAEFKQYEGGGDEDVEFECGSCGHIWKSSIDYGQTNFFFPTDE